MAFRFYQAKAKALCAGTRAIKPRPRGYSVGHPKIQQISRILIPIGIVRRLEVRTFKKPQHLHVLLLRLPKSVKLDFPNHVVKILEAGGALPERELGFRV